MSFKEQMKEDLVLVDKMLEEYLENRDVKIPRLAEAMRYTTMAGGKRIRAFLCLMFARLSGGRAEDALPFACAVEMIHAYSLIHDDLPCMDDDDMRRGKPSNHIVFGEAQALLAGDGLLTLAFETCAENKRVAPSLCAKAVSYLARYAGPYGMVGGQVLDLEGEKRKLTKDELHHVHSLKTGALIQAACVLGCCTTEKGLDMIETSKEYGLNLGLAFQVVDDILDVTSDEATLGKPIGSDSENNKTTFMDFMTLNDASEYTRMLTEKACAGLGECENSIILRDLAYYLLQRKN